MNSFDMNKLFRSLHKKGLYGIWAIGCLVACTPAQNDSAVDLDETQIRQAAHAIQGLEIVEDLEISLFASEPMLINPTNIEVDDRGRVWVCEAFNYRNHLNPQNPERAEGDRIVILEDTDGDGKADDSKVFYQGTDINSALGISLIGDQVVVSCSPNIIVFTDKDGDDQWEEKEIMFSGIEGVQHDHGAHAFVFGPDGKWYFNYGNEGKQLKDAAGNVVTDIYGNRVEAKGNPYLQGMVFRCNPDGSEVEVLAHNFRNNYEVAVDSYGTLWQSDNDDDGNKATRINYVMEYGNYGYQDAMTGAGWRTYRTGMHEEIPLRHWHLNDPGVVPNLLQTGAGSPTGILVYEGDLLPERFHNQMIHCDAGPNVVRSYPVTPKGAGYSAEMLPIVHAGADQWFRPSDVCVAPDGSLIVADWYDPGVGGHQMGDLEKGRIFRIAPPHTPYKIPVHTYDTPEGAVAALQSPNHAIRTRGWLALKDMGNEAEAALTSLWESDHSRMRARALWLLAQLPHKADYFVQKALTDADLNIKITGLRIARQADLELAPLLGQLVNDPAANAAIYREVALALRHLDSPEANALWAALADKYDGKDRWYLEALGIGSDLHADARLAAWAKRNKDVLAPTTNQADILWRSRAEMALPGKHKLITSTSTAKEAERYFRAMDFHPQPSKNKLLESLVLPGVHPEREKISFMAVRHMDPDFVKKSSIAQQELTPILARIKGTDAYMDLVDRLQLESEVPYLFDLAMNQSHTQDGAAATNLLYKLGKLDLFQPALTGKNEAQFLAALTAMSRINNQESLAVLEDIFRDERRDMYQRKLAVQYYGRGWNGENWLSEMLREDRIPEALKTTGATQLLSSRREGTRQLASEILNLDRADTQLPPIHELAMKEGNASQGKEVFKTHCQACHQVNGEGINFGPDLSEIGNKLSRSALYGSIINPSAGIGFGYEGYLVATQDGRKQVGFIASETEDQLELRMIGGLTSTINKAEVVEMDRMQESLMTAGLHRNMSQEELISLIEYLTTLKEKTKLLAN